MHVPSATALTVKTFGVLPGCTVTNPLHDPRLIVNGPVYPLSVNVTDAVSVSESNATELGIAVSAPRTWPPGPDGFTPEVPPPPPPPPQPTIAKMAKSETALSLNFFMSLLPLE